MKVSKKRLIEIVTEEISRVRKEAYYRKYTPGGSPHRDLDPRHSPRRRRRRSVPRRGELPPEPGPGDSNYDQGKEDALAQRDNFDHTTATWKPGTSDNIQPNRPQPRSTPEDRAYMKGYMHYLYRKDLDEAMQEGTWDDRPNRRKSRTQQMADANDHAEEDAEFIHSWDHDYDDRDLPHNHHGKYGWGPDEAGIGEAGKYYWKRRREVLDHFKKTGQVGTWYTNE